MDWAKPIVVQDWTFIFLSCGEVDFDREMDKALTSCTTFTPYQECMKREVGGVFFLGVEHLVDGSRKDKSLSSTREMECVRDLCTSGVLWLVILAYMQCVRSKTFGKIPVQLCASVHEAISSRTTCGSFGVIRFGRLSIFSTI